MNDQSVEKILCVDGALVDELIPDNQFTLLSNDVFENFRKLLETANFHPRPAVEDDPSYRQIIPYIILRRVTTLGCSFERNEEQKSKKSDFLNFSVVLPIISVDVFQYERINKKATSETRLAKRTSIGIGGHINTDDVPGITWTDQHEMEHPEAWSYN